MHLINVTTKRSKEFFDEDIPSYAVLSHTWGKVEEEVTFRDVLHGTVEKPGDGYAKFQGCCEQAKRDGLEYVWIDTCCINKDSARELDEAIRSMFHWYGKASVCYAYLSDVPPGDKPENKTSRFSSSRWFRRGWTLQELLAPRKLYFYDQAWGLLGDKTTLSSYVQAITGIPRPFLLGSVPLDEASVAQRMSWAANRRTKRREDVAYCLLGIFGVNMPMAYGEGDDAFSRLQKAIMERTGDDSILAWGFSLTDSNSGKPTDFVSGGVFATSPSDFVDCKTIVPRTLSMTPFEISAGLLRANLPLHTTSAGMTYGVLNCGPNDGSDQVIGIPLNRAEAREASPEFIRPQGHGPVSLPESASRAPPASVYVKIERIDAAMDRRYWFYIDDSNTDLKLVNVHPRSRWKPEWAMIATDNSPDRSSSQRYLALFSNRDQESRDVVVILDFAAEGPQRRAKCHVMTCSRTLDLDDLFKKAIFMGSDVFGKQQARYGRQTVSVTVNEEKMGRHPKFVVRLATSSRVPETTVDATSEMQQLELKGRLLKMLHRKDGIRPEAEGVHRERQETKASLKKWRARLTEVEEELKRLEGEKLALHAKANDGERALERLAKRDERLVQEQQGLSAEESEILKQLAGGLDQHTTNGWLGRMLQTMLDTDTIDVDLSDVPGGLEQMAKGSRRTPLSWAAANGRAAVVRRLLADDCTQQLEWRDDGGRTALALAAESGHASVVKMLLENKADVGARTSDGRTPLLLADGRGHGAVVRLLRDHGAAWEARSRRQGQEAWSRRACDANSTRSDSQRRLSPTTTRTDGSAQETTSAESASRESASRESAPRESKDVQVQDRFDSMSVLSSAWAGPARDVLAPSTQLSRAGLLFFSLTRDAKHMMPNASSYWCRLTLASYQVYEQIYHLCCDAMGRVYFPSFAAQLKGAETPTADTIAKTWSRLLPESGSIADSWQPKGLALATLYMLHVERFFPHVVPFNPSPDAAFTYKQRQVLKAFDRWVSCCCRADCGVEWNFANEMGLHRRGRPEACALARSLDGGSRLLGFLRAGKREGRAWYETRSNWVRSRETSG